MNIIKYIEVTKAASIYLDLALERVVYSNVIFWTHLPNDKICAVSICVDCDFHCNLIQLIFEYIFNPVTSASIHIHLK